MKIDKLEEFFKQRTGMHVRMNKNHLGSYNLFIDVGVIDNPTLDTVDKMIKEMILAHPALKRDFEIEMKERKEMEEYRTFFRLLRGSIK